jgi:hypothetical protein
MAKIDSKHGTQKEALISEMISELCRNSTSHSLQKIGKSKHLLIKIIWIVSSIFSISFCSYVIIKTVGEYLKYDVVTNIRVHTEIEPEYPSITFCNKNPIVKEEGRQIFLNYLKEMNVTNYEENLETNSNFYDLSDLYQRTMTFLLTNTTDEQKKKMGYSLEEMTLICEFNFVKCENSEFVWFYDKEYGNCYKFNTGINSTGHSIAVRTVNSRGRGTGLNLALFIGTENGIRSFNPFERSEGKRYFQTELN